MTDPEILELAWQDYGIAPDRNRLFGKQELLRFARDLAAPAAPTHVPDEPCYNCGLGHPSSNCVYKTEQSEQTPPSRAALISELESTTQNLLLNAVGAERVRHAVCLLRSVPAETWKVLPSAVRVARR